MIQMKCKHPLISRTYCRGVSLSGVSRSNDLTPEQDNKASLDAAIARSLHVAPDVTRRITLLLNRIRSGQNDVFTSPLLKERTPQEVLSGLDTIVQNSISKLNPVLQSLELDVNRPKFGPMSIAKDWGERKDSLYDSYTPYKTSKTFAPFSLGNKQRLRPISVPNAIGYLKNDSNSGMPYMTKKKNVKASFMGYTIEDLVKVVGNFVYYELYALKPSGWSLNLACLLFTRTQEAGKTRNVWGYPIIATILEMCFYRPLLDIQSKQSWRSALRKPDDVSRAVTKLIDTCIAEQLDVISIDFGRYDNTVKSPLIRSAFTVIKLAFQDLYKRAIDVIMDFMIECPIVTPDGVITGEHGIPSGSTFTNEVDSIVQYGISLECPRIYYKTLSQVQGDDGLYASDNAEAVFKHFSDFGLVVNVEKSYVAKNWGIYLQSLFHADYRDENGIINGIYPIYRALNRILFLERFDDFSEYGISGTDYFSIRTISILENCKHHPLFDEFVEYVWSLDKYRLKVSDQGLANYVRKLAIQEGKDITFRNWSYGSDVSGLKTFETVKLIDKLNRRV